LCRCRGGRGFLSSIPWRFCFARRVWGLSALARPRSLRAKTPRATTQQCVPGRAPRRPHETASPTPHPGSARWGPRGLRRDGRLHPPSGPSPPPKDASRTSQAGPWRAGGWRADPPHGRKEPSRRSVRAPDALAGVGIRRGCLTPTPRGHTVGSALGSHAKASRRAGLDAQPERRLRARGARKEPHAMKEERPGVRGPEAPPHRFMSMSMMAFWTWRRFSASSKITDHDPSATAAATSSPRWHGRQCMKIASLSAVSISSGVT